jgi:hypothetical protein
MVQEAALRARDPDSVNIQTYRQGFDRRNILATAKWDSKAGRIEGAKLAASLAGRRVVMLGKQTSAAMGLKQAEWWRETALQLSDVSSLVAWVVPHPSGMNLMYNDPSVRAATGDLLYRLLREVPS